MTETLPYGTWPSPLSAAALAAGTVGLSDVRVDGDDVLWQELRPSEGGRMAVVRHDGEEATDVGPSDLNVRTRVHEYGGAAYAVRDGAVVASEFVTQRLYRLTADTAEPLTPEPPAAAAVRFADGMFHPTADVLYAVRETHGDGPEAVNEIVAIDLADGSERVLVTGRDFVSSPRPSADGTQLAWVAWDHPDMPWDAAELWVAPLDPDDPGALGDRMLVAGGGETAAVCPAWAATGRLFFALDDTGFWELHVREPDGSVRRLTDVGADAGEPMWTFGTHTIAPLADGRVAVARHERAGGRLELTDPDTGTTEVVDLPYANVTGVRAWRDGVVFLASAPDLVSAVVSWTPTDGAHHLREARVAALRDGDAPVGEPIEVPTPDGAITHAFLYRPRNATVRGTEDERPPLLVFTHGGPTGNVYAGLSPGVAYWTTRGFAVADVNYRGSTGYGRAYRNALRGRWGELDVVDTVAVARFLADQGIVDGDRMAIRGGSAGGYTTLAVLTSGEDVFAAGCSFFGVGDLLALAAHTHKFEARYLDRIIGPLPEFEDVYRDRSPLTHVDRLRTPLLVLQGLEDVVVPPEQAEAIVAAAARQGVPHAYLAFEGEQHGFRKAENIVTWLESELAFYGQVMGLEPAGDLPALELSRG